MRSRYATSSSATPIVSPSLLRSVRLLDKVPRSVNILDMETTTKEQTMQVKAGDRVRTLFNKKFWTVLEVTTNARGEWVKLDNPTDGWMPSVWIKAHEVVEVAS